MKERKPQFHYGSEETFGEDPGSGIADMESYNPSDVKSNRVVKILHTPTGKRFLIGFGIGAAVAATAFEINHLLNERRENRIREREKEKDQA